MDEMGEAERKAPLRTQARVLELEARVERLERLIGEPEPAAKNGHSIEAGR